MLLFFRVVILLISFLFLLFRIPFPFFHFLNLSFSFFLHFIPIRFFSFLSFSPFSLFCFSFFSSFFLFFFHFSLILFFILFFFPSLFLSVSFPFFSFFSRVGQRNLFLHIVTDPIQFKLHQIGYFLRENSIFAIGHVIYDVTHS